MLRIANHVSGFIIIVSALFLGSLIAHYAAVPVPGNILGMTILLLLLALRIVPVALVSPASTTLLALLPSLFVTLYVPPFSDKAFWLDYGGVLLPVVGGACAAIIILARVLAAAMIRR